MPQVQRSKFLSAGFFRGTRNWENTATGKAVRKELPRHLHYHGRVNPGGKPRQHPTCIV